MVMVVMVKEGIASVAIIIGVVTVVGVTVAIIIGVVAASIVGVAVAGNVRESSVVWVTTEVWIAWNATFV